MKNLRRLCAVAMLTFVLAISTLAEDGQGHTGIATPMPTPVTGQTHTGGAQPSPSANGEMTTTVAGQMETGSTAAGPLDLVTQIALGLLQDVLSLF